MILVLLIVTGMLRYLLGALVNSFTLIPIGGVRFNLDSISSSLINFLGDYMSIGFRICLPIFAVILILSAVLGILAKVAPQMNMFAVGMPLKVLVGFGILFLTLGMLSGVSAFIFSEMKKMIHLFVGGLM